MGIVDENGVIAARRWHDLDAALYARRRAERAAGVLQPNAEGAGNAERQKRVRDCEASGDADADMCRLLPFPHLHRHMVRRKLHLLCAQRGVLPGADEQRRTGRTLQHGPVSRVVRIEHTRPAKPEQAGLGGPVGLHGLMEIEVVLRQVRERTDRERDAVHAVQRQRMGRDLHHHMRAARIEHLPQQALQGKALGRRALRRDDGVADAVFDRADEADLRAEHLLEQRADPGGHNAHDAEQQQRGECADRRAQPRNVRPDEQRVHRLDSRARGQPQQHETHAAEQRERGGQPRQPHAAERAEILPQLLPGHIPRAEKAARERQRQPRAADFPFHSAAPPKHKVTAIVYPHRAGIATAPR